MKSEYATASPCSIDTSAPFILEVTEPECGLNSKNEWFITPSPFVSVKNSVLIPINPRAGISNSIKKSFNINDGVIYSGEIETTNFTNTSLVVLSACESALGETNLVGGFNLSNSFHKAGVKNVISTLWEIDDEKTMQFMNLFYRKLMILKDPKESLNSAKEDFKKSIKYYSENPRLLDSIIKDLRDSLEKVFTGISHDVNEDDQMLVQQDSVQNILKESPKFIDNMKFKKDLKPRIKSGNQILDTLKI